ncbi:type IV secretion system protein VirB10 [Methylorubrum rhodinum]|uniref:Type IV secretion system protein VirB10 n=2 Tax=Methylorubrum TaxID=2282523 RepID=A0A840ZNC6_9HYPH|nr:type IV secretion system protein VirB10 [Methylorubrum rhodinum]MBB5758555.1 type IV secretion system protein VirB10 [Methylorubrum rhodinum]
MTDPHDAQSLNGSDRAITPVAGAATARPGSARKVAGTVALVALCGGLLWASWKRAPSEPETRTNPTISVASSFERLREPPSEPAQTAALPVSQPPPASPQRVERSPADDLLESSRRAPVLVYNRPPQARSGSASPGYPNDPASPLSYGLGYGAPEPRNELSDKLKPTPIEGVQAARLPNRNLLVAQGTAIPCVLETAMSSDVAGFVSCVINRDVMSDNGNVVLMEKGTQVVGEYRGTIRRGSSRMFVLWSRAKTPTGVIVNLASPATDALGRAGFDGEIDGHFMERFGGALLLSIVGDAGQFAGQQFSDGGLQINSVQRGGQSAAAIATENSINIPPTLNKNQGELVSIFVARDLDFSSVYALRVTGRRTDLLDRAAGLPPRRPVFKP